jgi:hypothetical protein
MSSLRARSFTLLPLAALPLLPLAALAACGPSTSPPDAAPPPSMIPTSPAGVFALTSQLDLRVPAPAAPVIAALTAATDGPDDPTRYLIDRIVQTLPDGTIRTVAAQAAPYLAAYLNARLVEIAPRFVAGIDAIASGTARVASHFTTIETLQIDRDGAATRSITGARFELPTGTTVIRFAEHGLPDLAIGLRVALDVTGHVTLGAHAQAVPYGALLRLALDRAVVPGVVAGAPDLAAALAALVDCGALGAMIADRLGLGSPGLYGAACRTAMTAIASELDARIAAIDRDAITLEVSGAAEGVDLDSDGTLDALRAGRWTGSLRAAGEVAPITAASFTAGKAP